ncbi:MAG: hypothetical protein CM15mP63_4560 [Gammaproteobacteria bacterium]|jgi:hypothetical protein|nr:MAG: hypothetical protein CM15mP63_4560 [Gammaproteobacteria bacterium]
MNNFILPKILRDLYCDVTFYFPIESCCKNIFFKKIECHKILLSIHSDYFNSFFNFQSDNKIIINGYSYDEFKVMIDYLYDNNLKFDFNDSNFLLKSLKLSDEYMLENYKKIILNRIKIEIDKQKYNLSFNNYLDYLILLKEKSNELLLDECINLITEIILDMIKKSENSEKIIYKLLFPKKKICEDIYDDFYISKLFEQQL